MSYKNSDSWLIILNFVTEYIKRHNKQPPKNLSIDNKNLYHWIRNQRSKYKRKIGLVTKSTICNEAWKNFEIKYYYKFTKYGPWQKKYNEVLENINKGIIIDRKWIWRNNSLYTSRKEIMKHKKIREIWKSFIASEPYIKHYKYTQWFTHYNEMISQRKKLSQVTINWTKIQRNLWFNNKMPKVLIPYWQELRNIKKYHKYTYTADEQWSYKCSKIINYYRVNGCLPSYGENATLRQFYKRNNIKYNEGTLSAVRIPTWQHLLMVIK